MKPGRVLAFGGFSAMFSICSFFAADWQRVLDEFLHLLEQSLVGLCVSLSSALLRPSNQLTLKERPQYLRLLLDLLMEF